MNGDPDYWARNVRARLEQSADYDPEEFEVEEADEDSPESAVLHVSRADDDYDEDDYVRFTVFLQRGGFEVYPDSERPLEGVYVARREPLEYPYAEEDR